MGLAFFPSCTVFSDHEKVGSMKDAEVPPARAIVIELESRRLVVVLQHIRIMLHLIYRGQFHTMTLKLHRKSHLSRGVPAGNVAAAASDAPRWSRLPDIGDHRAGAR